LSLPRSSGAIRLGGPDLFGVQPSWSPDGGYIAFKHLDGADQNGYGIGGLWLIDADGSHPRPLAKAGGRANALLSTAWSPDGKRLAFLAHAVDGNLNVYVINTDVQASAISRTAGR
jgi:Tol biopolymer transport system component